MNPLLKNDTRDTHWELSEDDSNNLLTFLFPDQALFLKSKGALAENKTDHHTMDVILDYFTRQALYVKSDTSPATSGSGSFASKGKKDRKKKTSYWVAAPDLNAKATTACETRFAIFFNSIIRAAHDAVSTVTVRTWDAKSATHPLNGGDAARSPSLSCWIAPGSRFEWGHLATFAEVKMQGGKDNEKSSYIETADKASCMLYAQDGRHAAPCIRILGSKIYFMIFDRGGSLSTCGYDIHQHPDKFLRILIGLTSAPHNILGFDISIKWGQKYRDGKLVEIKELTVEVDAITHTIEFTKVLFIADNLFGRGTTVWEGAMSKEGGVGVRQVAVKDSWIDPLRKYTEGKILSILNAHKIEGVPTLVHEQQVQTPYPSSIPDIMVNSSTHFLRTLLSQRKTGFYHLRVLSRIITQPVGNPITEFSCLGELLVAFLDYVVAHKDALEIARILHCDVSLGNLFLTRAAQRSNHQSLVEKHSNLPKHEKAVLCTRIGSLKWRGVLGDWGYADPRTECTSTTASMTAESPDSSASSIELPSEMTELVDSFDVPVAPVNSMNAQTRLTPVSDLTKEDNIVLAMGSETDPHQEVDPPLYRTGTWSWMSAELSMADAEQQVMHDHTHDLESFFYVLVGICVLLDGPKKPKCDKELAQCFDKYFNVCEPSVLKTITIQSNLTWQPYILHHISEYFEPIIPLLTRLREDIVVPLFADNEGKVHRRVDLTYDMFINAIIETLSDLSPEAWMPVGQENDDGGKSDPKPDNQADVPSPLPDTADPGPPNQDSVDSRLTRCRIREETGEVLEHINFPQKRQRLS